MHKWIYWQVKLYSEIVFGITLIWREAIIASKHNSYRITCNGTIYIWQTDKNSQTAKLKSPPIK